MTDWKEVRGSESVKPNEIDINSSSSTVYQRKNITLDPETKEWIRQERTLSREEYVAGCSANFASADDMATVQTALADVYDLLDTISNKEVV